jgi:hypothetical protein
MPVFHPFEKKGIVDRFFEKYLQVMSLAIKDELGVRSNWN